MENVTNVLTHLAHTAVNLGLLFLLYVAILAGFPTFVIAVLCVTWWGAIVATADHYIGGAR